ncbi:dehydrodolichyl diphosphate synthase complex subunit nus1-like [Dermacentor albipictus]|uniref:dehydrodolichyl diphosphate synthase complex subunit nus1-like n=1 Tax=Dermacentor albipictus TaxID=60249 RepID=UPI0038FD186E
MGDYVPGRPLRNLAMAVAGVFGYALLLLIQYCVLAHMTAKSWLRKWRHRIEHPAINSATGYAAVVVIKERTHKLADKPRNVGLLFLEEQIGLEAVAKVILWCLALGVESASAYDMNGTLLHKLDRLKEIMKNTLVDARYKKSAVEFVVARPEGEADDHERSAGGQEQFTGLPVYVVTPVDGKGGLVAAFRKICDHYKLGTLDDKDVTPETLDKYIKAEYRGMPEPQLAMRFGGWGSVLGYPAWHINYSEILDLGSHRNVLLSEFIETLEKYNKIEKRFGK